MEAKAQQKQYKTREGVAKSVIQIFPPRWNGSPRNHGTQSPMLPTEYRGPFGTINTSIKGIKFSQNLKHTAKIADKMTIIRSMAHGEAAHERGTHNMFTGLQAVSSTPISSNGFSGGPRTGA